eukprot:gene15646-6930_t
MENDIMDSFIKSDTLQSQSQELSAKSSQSSDDYHTKSSRGPKGSLTHLEEFILVLMRLKVDSTVSPFVGSSVQHRACLRHNPSYAVRATRQFNGLIVGPCQSAQTAHAQ